MLTRSRWAWAGGLLLLGCYSPRYHDGNLRCTSSGQCPRGYHCAVDQTCWHNGRDPDAGPAEDAGTGAVPEGGRQSQDQGPDRAGKGGQAWDATSEVDRRDTPDLPSGDLADAPVPPDARDDGDRPVDAVVQPDALDASGPEDGGGVSLAQLAAAYARAVCSRNFACCTQADLKGKSLATCESTISNQLQPGLGLLTDGIERGRTLYHPDRAGRCLQEIEGTGCASWPIVAMTGLPAGCANVTEPQVAAGGACQSAVECTTGLCSGATAKADGTCLPRAGSAQACIPILFQNSCQDGLACGPDDVCALTKPEGSACTRARDCESQVCGPAPDAGADAGSVCRPALCFSSGPFVPAGCSMSRRPAACPPVFLLPPLLAGVALWRRRGAGSRFLGPRS